MISAIAIVCSLVNPSDCQTVSSARIFPTVEMCEGDRVNAEGFAAANGYTVVLFHCYNWGEST